MCEEKRAAQLLLSKIKANTEYLTNIVHESESHTFLQYQERDIRICSFSTSKLLVQMSYLLFTCSALRVNIYLSNEPFFSKKREEKLLSPFIKFFLDQEYEQYINPKNEKNFHLRQWNSFDSTILPSIVGLAKKMFNSLAEKPQEQWEAKIGLKGLIQTINKKIGPKLLSSPQIPVIKHLQQTKVFRKGSDLLMAFNNSLFYQLKKNQKCILLLKGKKKSLGEKMDYINRGINTGYAFRILDDYFNELISNGLLGVEKSSTKDYKDCEGLNVGYVDYAKDEKIIDKYIARFYNFESNTDSHQQFSPEIQSKKERNNLILEYSIQKLEIIVRFVTPLEANSESIDIISIHCANIMSGGSSITLEIIDSIRNTSQGVTTRKYVTFKSFYKLQTKEEPLTRILLLIEHVILCGRIFMEILIKRPRRDQSAYIEECNYRLEHLCKTVLHKAEVFYSKL